MFQPFSNEDIIKYIDYKAIENIKSDKIKIVEVWQGHLDNYYGFQNAIETLNREFNNG